MGERFIPQTELFVYRSDGVVWVQPPGTASWVPPSVEVYRRRPKDWWDDPESRQWGVNEEAKTTHVLGVLPKGAKLTVSRVNHFTAIGREIPRVFGYTDIPEFADQELRFYWLISFKGGVPRPKRKYIVPYEEVR